MTRPDPVVSSAHLAAGASPGLSEVEFGMMLAMRAYERWMLRCMAAAGVAGLSPLDVLVLHTVRHRDRPKRLADIALVLDIEEPHLANYAVRKLAGLNLVSTSRAGKDKVVAATAAGIAVCTKYAAIRERLLAERVRDGGPTEAALSDVAGLLRSLSGFYQQAARSAATL
jgi:predicted MarR family transcription regulator